jgi:hypothetical protein
MATTLRHLTAARHILHRCGQLHLGRACPPLTSSCHAHCTTTHARSLTHYYKQCRNIFSFHGGRPRERRHREGIGKCQTEGESKRRSPFGIWGKRSIALADSRREALFGQSALMRGVNARETSIFIMVKVLFLNYGRPCICMLPRHATALGRNGIYFVAKYEMGRRPSSYS